MDNSNNNQYGTSPALYYPLPRHCVPALLARIALSIAPPLCAAAIVSPAVVLVIVLVIVGHCWSLLVIVGHCWSLLVIVGHCWSLFGHCWSLFGHCWSLFGHFWSLGMALGMVIGDGNAGEAGVMVK